MSAHHLRFRCVLYDEHELSEISPMVYMTDLSLNGTCLVRAGVDESDEGFLMTRSHGDVLLAEGDQIFLTPMISIRYHTEKLVKELPLTGIRSAEAKVQGVIAQA